MNVKWLIISFSFGLMFTACSKDEVQNKTTKNPVSKMVSSSSDKTVNKSIVEKQKLLFFINPNGRPCQIQNTILEKIRSQINEKADVIYVKTTDPSARDLFYKYGIRSLPSIIIADSKGGPIKRFPPGIQNEDTILNVLKAF